MEQRVKLSSTNSFNLDQSRILWFGVKNELSFSEQKAFEKLVGKGENVGCQHFLLFPQSFLAYQRQKPVVYSLPNNKFLDWTKFKALADDKI